MRWFQCWEKSSSVPPAFLWHSLWLLHGVCKKGGLVLLPRLSKIMLVKPPQPGVVREAVREVNSTRLSFCLFSVPFCSLSLSWISLSILYRYHSQRWATGKMHCLNHLKIIVQNKSQSLAKNFGWEDCAHLLQLISHLGVWRGKSTNRKT